MEEIEEIVRFLEENGVKVSSRVKSLKGLWKYLNTQKVLLELSIRRLEGVVSEKRKKLEVINKALDMIGGRKQ